MEREYNIFSKNPEKNFDAPTPKTIKEFIEAVAPLCKQEEEDGGKVEKYQLGDEIVLDIAMVDRSGGLIMLNFSGPGLDRDIVLSLPGEFLKTDATGGIDSLLRSSNVSNEEIRQLTVLLKDIRPDEEIIEEE